MMCCGHLPLVGLNMIKGSNKENGSNDVYNYPFLSTDIEILLKTHIIMLEILIFF